MQREKYVFMETSLTALINHAADEFTGNHEEVKGVQVSISDSINERGQTVCFFSEIPNEVSEVLILQPKKPFTKSYHDEGIPHLGIYFNFPSDFFLFNGRKGFFRDWTKALEEWDRSQDEMFRNFIRTHYMSEIMCMKDSNNLVHVAMEIQTNAKSLCSIGIHSLNIMR